MSVLGLLVNAAHIFDFSLAVGHMLEVAKQLELVRLEFSQVKQIEFLETKKLASQ